MQSLETTLTDIRTACPNITIDLDFNHATGLPSAQFRNGNTIYAVMPRAAQYDHPNDYIIIKNDPGATDAELLYATGDNSFDTISLDVAGSPDITRYARTFNDALETLAGYLTDTFEDDTGSVSSPSGETHATIHFDGGSRGNPGDGSAGATIETDDNTDELSVYLGDDLTNNQAEYHALTLALNHAIGELDIDTADIYGDSQLVIKQLKREWDINDDRLNQLAMGVQYCFNELDDYTLNHIPREQNSTADNLADKALNTKDTSMNPE